MTEQKEGLETKYISCFVCKKVYHGLANPVKNTEKCWVYYWRTNRDKHYCVSCDDQKCCNVLIGLIKGCMICGALSFNVEESNKGHSNEDHNIGYVEVLCSRECKIKMFKQCEEDISKGVMITKICQTCKVESLDMLTCDKCKIAYYCSKDCQATHDKTCNNKP